MKISYISIEGIKGRRMGVAIDKPHLFLCGTMGSGKSAVIEGLHLALGLPTQFGNMNLDRLSPTGQWSVAIEFANGDVRRVERSMHRGKSVYKLNNMKADQGEYYQVIRSVLEVDPHHVDLDEFLRLSGQKRAALFAALLEQSEPQTVFDALQTGERCGLEEFFRRTCGEDLSQLAGTLGKVKALSGAPSRLVEGLNEMTNAAGQAERDAKIRLEGLIGQQASLTHGMTPMELKQKLQGLDEEFGGLTARKANLTVERERYEAADQLRQKSLKLVELHQQKLVKLKAVAAEREAREEALDEALKQGEVASKAHDAAIDERGEADKQLAGIVDQLSALSRAHGLVADLIGQTWDVDTTWLQAEFAELLSLLNIEPAEEGNDLVREKMKIIVLKFVREVVTEVFGGDQERIDGKMKEVEAQIVAQEEHLSALQSKVNGAFDTRTSTDLALDKCRDALTEAQKAKAAIAEAENLVEQMEKSRAELEQKVQQTAATEDETALDSQLEALAEKREVFDRQLKELEDAQAISGQVELQRLEVARSSLAQGCLKRLLDAIQRWRDTIVREQIANMMTPFRQAFQKVFGEDMQIMHRSRGQGRSTEFYFTIKRRGIDVPFDLLSDGEVVLTAASFLTALQSIKNGPGSFLSLNTEPLDVAGLLKLLMAVPALSLDFTILANNRAEEVISRFPESLQEWQVVNMDDPPLLRI